MKPIDFSDHVLQRMIERGTTRQEVEDAVRRGRQVPAREGKIAFRLNLRYQGTRKILWHQTSRADRS